MKILELANGKFVIRVGWFPWTYRYLQNSLDPYLLIKKKSAIYDNYGTYQTLEQARAMVVDHKEFFIKKKLTKKITKVVKVHKV
jgi:hypothetical protein